MVDLSQLSLEELSGVVNSYPWFGGAHLELCRRMASSGAWTREQFVREALYVADRKKVYLIMTSASGEEAPPKKHQEEVRTIIAPSRKVHVAGGDYFSQEQYDSARNADDGELARKVFAKVRDDKPSSESAAGDITERFCTEALAEIFAEQGFTLEAKRIYSRLILEFPEKSAYFAALIEKLEQKI